MTLFLEPRMSPPIPQNRMPTTYRTAVVMIARNEARCIARCLRSLRPWVDEMIVLDTGSTDGTDRIAADEGAKVGRFTWVDDFSAARNAALTLSDADWNIVVDADEHLVRGGEILTALRSTPPAFVARLEQFNPFELSGAEGQAPQVHTASSWLPRILPRGVRFAGTIHEQPESKLPRQDLDIRLQHDGYLPQQILTKGERNLRLLHAAVRQQPEDAYLRYQLGKELELHDRFDPAAQQFEAAMTLLGPDAGRNPGWRHDLILRYLYALKASHRLTDALRCAEQEHPHWSDSPDFYFIYGDLLLDLAIQMPDHATTLLPMIRDAWEQCLRIGENPALEGAVHGRGSYLAQKNLSLLAMVGLSETN